MDYNIKDLSENNIGAAGMLAGMYAAAQDKLAAANEENKRLLQEQNYLLANIAIMAMDDPEEIPVSLRDWLAEKYDFSWEEFN